MAHRPYCNRQPRHKLRCWYLLLALIGLNALWLAAPDRSSAATAEATLRRQILAGQDALYRGEFDQALTRFTAITDAYPRDPRGYFLIALTYRWLTRIDPDADRYQEQFEQAAAAAIDVAEARLDRDDRDLDALLSLAAVHGYRAEYYNFLKNRWSKAYDDAVKMRKYLKKARDRVDPELSIDIRLGFGLYNYYAYVYRKKIGWWRFALSLPKGDKQKGLEQLHQVKEHGTYFRVEAWYFLIEICRKDSDCRDQALPLCQALHQTYPKQLYFHVLLAGIYHRQGDWQNSMLTAENILKQAQHNPYASDFIIYQAKYLIGESAFKIGDHTAALQHFNDIIKARPESPEYLLPWSHLRRGTIYAINGQRDKAVAEYELVLTMKDTYNVHDVARGLLQHQQTKEGS
jgi:hypothetical protein